MYIICLIGNCGSKLGITHLNVGAYIYTEQLSMGYAFKHLFDYVPCGEMHLF